MTGPIGGLINLYHSIQDPDKAKREAFARFLASNPDTLQKLTDSPLSDDPKQFQDLFIGQNARWGRNSSAASNLTNTITGAALSPLEQAKQMTELQGNVNDIADASKKAPGIRALNTISPNDISNVVAPALADGTAVSQSQKDILAKANGQETSYQLASRALDDASRKAQTISATAQANESTARALGLMAGAQKEQAQNELDTNSNKIVDDYLNANPKMRGSKLSDLFNSKNDNLVPPAVRNALLTAPKYADTLKTQISLETEKARQGLEQQRITNDKILREEWLPKLQQANALEAMTKFGGADITGYLDYYQGKQSPGADAAAQAIAGSSPRDKNAAAMEYNTKLQDLLGKKGLTPDEANAGIAALNIFGKRLQGMGIQTPTLSYGVPKQTQGISGAAASLLPDFMRNKNIQVSGNTPSVQAEGPAKVNYDPNTDKNLLMKADQEYQQMLADPANKNVPPAILEKRIKAKYGLSFK